MSKKNSNLSAISASQRLNFLFRSATKSKGWEVSNRVSDWSLVVAMLLAIGCADTEPTETKSATAETSENLLKDIVVETSSLDANEKQVDALLELIRQRLLLMHEVARWKWNESRPVEAPERERQLLDRLVEKGKSRHLEEEFVRKFFGAQIDAAKMVQRADFEKWTSQKQGPFSDVRDLKTDLREDITDLSEKLLDILATIQKAKQFELVRSLLQERSDNFLIGESFSSDVLDTALAPLLK